MLLTLPVFAPEVPPFIEFSEAGERTLRLALAMSRLGMIYEADLGALRRSKLRASTIRALIDKGWQRALDGHYSFQLISAQARLILPHKDGEPDFTGENGAPLVGVTINAGHPEWIAIGRAFSAIERLQPGLGRKALHILEGSLCHFGMPYTAGGAFQMAQHLYWLGEDDESTALEEFGDDDVSVPRRIDLFDGIPEWAYGYSTALPAVTDEGFAAAADTAQTIDHPTAPLLAALLQLNRIDSDAARFAAPYESDGWYRPNEPPVVCGWNSETDFDGIFDDYYRNFSESDDEAPWCGSVMFPPTETGISEAIPRIRHTGRVLGALDVALLKARELNHEL